jgi:hypothetical protein
VCQIIEDYAKKLTEEAIKHDRQKTILNMINLEYTKDQILEVGFNDDEYEQAKLMKKSDEITQGLLEKYTPILMERQAQKCGSGSASK